MSEEFLKTASNDELDELAIQLMEVNRPDLMNLIDLLLSLSD